MRMMEKISKKDIYRDFKLEYPNSINYNTYCKILLLYAKFFIEDLFEGKKINTICGSFNFTKRLTKKPLLDYKEYNETGIKVFTFNEHTKNYSVFLRWVKPKSKTSSRLPYRVTMVRSLNRLVAKKIKENPQLINQYEFHKY
jgi:hypothetical protein